MNPRPDFLGSRSVTVVQVCPGCRAQMVATLRPHAVDGVTAVRSVLACPACGHVDEVQSRDEAPDSSGPR